MAKLILVVAFLWLYSSNSCQGQGADSVLTSLSPLKKYYLVLDKPGIVKRIRFYPGTRLTFKLTDDKRLYAGKIEAIRKHSVVIFNTELPIRDIRKVRVPQQAPMGKFLYGLGSGMRGVGTLFALIGGGNYLLTSDQKNGRVTAQAGLGLLGVGQLFRGFNRRTYKINKNRRLKTIEII
jgi:hypothetical protein